MTEHPLATPQDVLAFWRAAGPQRWYARDEAFDRDLAARFLATWQAAAAGDLAHWRDTDAGTLALVIVLDQFPRNIFRDDARAFSTDAMAREVARHAIQDGLDRRVDAELRQFLYLPLMHSERLADQEHCVALFRDQGGSPDNLKFAEIHADIIRRFGRFPHRNRVLGRTTTKDEQAFLDSGGFSG
jgi:uncharacterized protein (DUF924 family)